MSTVNDLDPSLQALLACKPPGVTKSKIASITTLCMENVKVNDSVPAALVLQSLMVS